MKPISSEEFKKRVGQVIASYGGVPSSVPLSLRRPETMTEEGAIIFKEEARRQYKLDRVPPEHPWFLTVDMGVSANYERVIFTFFQDDLTTNPEGARVLVHISYLLTKEDFSGRIQLGSEGKDAKAIIFKTSEMSEFREFMEMIQLFTARVKAIMEEV